MRHIILVSHGQMCEGILTSLEMIAGKQENIHIVQLKADGDNIKFENDLIEVMGKIDGEKIIITDIPGGTPCNVSVNNYLMDDTVEIVSGLSLPLLLECVMNRENMVDNMVELGKSGIVNIKKQVISLINEEEE
ncbi:MAG: PTS sugar transporter subunit IIA [Clostridium sp.]